MRAFRYTFLILAVAIITRMLAPVSTRAANKDTELILAELRQLQAQVSQIQRAQGEIERQVKLLASRAETDGVQQLLVDTQTTLEDVKENISVLSSRLDETNSRIGNLRQEIASTTSHARDRRVGDNRRRGKRYDGWRRLHRTESSRCRCGS